MLRLIEAIVDHEGNVKLTEPIELPVESRALVIILDEQPQSLIAEAVLLSGSALAEDWSRPEEDEAWSHL